MNVQIFGKSKCFDTKKAERYFKERNIPFQFIDMQTKGMSKGELVSVLNAVGGIDKLIDSKNKSDDAILLKYIDDDAKLIKLLENPKLIATPVVRNGKLATVGFCPEVWKNWK